MLGHWRSHAEYQAFVSAKLAEIGRVAPFAVAEYRDEVSKLWILNLDPMKVLVAPLYSPVGRPSELQPEIFRSLSLMVDLGYSPDEWVFRKLPANPVLQAICGFSGKLPGIASYYDFIRRLIKIDEKPRLKRKKRKPRKKLGKGQKIQPKRSGIVQKLVDKILAGKRFNHRPERILQEIFARVAVAPSVDLGLVPYTVSISGDGTCVKTGASPFGRKICDCKDFKCDCNRRFSDPNASWGWDSLKEQYFFGYTGYFISTYNKAEKLDLPLYLRLVDAKRFDGVTAVVALAEFRDLYPNLKIDTFISDSASDNNATYKLLDAWGINAVITLAHTKSGNFKHLPALTIDESGVPVCPGGNKMVFNGFCHTRSRFKWRCPKVCDKLCEKCVRCSPSAYGRVIYTKPEWDLRLFTKIPRGTERWKLKMNERTAAERVNNRILNHYGLENSRARGKARISFFATIAALNVHLDAQLAKLKALGKFDFANVVSLPQSA